AAGGAGECDGVGVFGGEFCEFLGDDAVTVWWEECAGHDACGLSAGDRERGGLSGGECFGDAAEEGVMGVCVSFGGAAVECVAIHEGAGEGGVRFGDGDVVSEYAVECIEEVNGFGFWGWGDGGEGLEGIVDGEHSGRVR
ncbi:MAG: hypothetical protein RL215_3198, partial [Planctomycetota bacterium]